MKPLRLVLIGLLSVVLLLVILVALASSPGVQTWIARKFAPSSADLAVDIGRVDAGLNQTRVENVRVIQPGLVLTIPSAEVEVGVIDAAGGRIEVKRFVAKGWILDLTVPVGPIPVEGSVGAPKSPGAADGSAVSKKAGKSAQGTFDGLFQLLDLPFDLVVDGVELAGEVILPEGRAHVSIIGGGIASGKDGKFTLTSDYKGADATALAVRGIVAARMDSPRTFDRFDITATASATGPKLPEGAKLDVSLTAAREGEGETYVAALRSSERDIVKADFKLPTGTAPLVGSWTLDLTSADAVPFSFGQPLPDVVAKGQGAFEANRAFTQIKTTGNLEASLDKLAAVQPEFAALGRLGLTVDFDIATHGDLVRLNKLDARVSGVQPVASITALQSIEFNPATRAVTAADASTDLLRITLDGIPLVWAKPFLGDLAVTGDDVRGAFTASVRDGGFVVRSAEPVTVTNLSIAQAGESLIRAVDISLKAQVDYSPKGWNAEVTDLSASSRHAPLFKLTAKAAQPADAGHPIVVSGAFEADIPVLLAQPVAAGSLALKRGQARGSFSATLAKMQQATLTMQLADLVASNSRSLPSVGVQAEVDIDVSGRIDAKAPIIITQAGRRSDVTLEAVLTTVGKDMNIRGKLTGDTLHLPDVMLFSALTETADEPTPDDAPEGTPQTPDTDEAPADPASGSSPAGPLWAGVTGELKLVFKRIIYSKDVETTMDGLIKITPSAITLENLGAAVKTGGKLKADGALKFDATKKKTYGLKADVALNDIDPAPILRALSPKEPSPVEGKYDFTTQLAGRAVDPSKFSDNVVGDIHLTSKGGTFKALNVKTSAIVDGAGAVASIAGLFGTMAGSSSTVKYAERTRVAADIAKQLGAIKFDQLNVVLGRDRKKNMEIKDLTLISPLIHLTGSGQITHVPGVSRLRQPFRMDLQLGAKNKLAEDLRTLKLADVKEDKLGYVSMTETIMLDGSLESIGTKQLEKLIRDALLN
jgi:hypothetical protein